MIATNRPRGPALTLFYAWQCIVQGMSLKSTGEFLQRNPELIIALLTGKAERDDPEVQGVRKWIRMQCGGE